MLLIKAHPGLKGSSPSSMNKFLLFHPLLVIISVIPVFPRRWSFFCGGHYFMVVLLSWGSLFHGVHYSMGVIISWGSLFHGDHNFMVLLQSLSIDGTISCPSQKDSSQDLCPAIPFCGQHNSSEGEGVKAALLCWVSAQSPPQVVFSSIPWMLWHR